jgi:phenylpyruvate tautomerase PptA (4-oxalocrotonate tautomerase family)
MPIITIRAVVDANEPDFQPDVVQAIADQLGELFALGARETWVRLERVPEAVYAENEGRSRHDKPTFIEVLKGRLPDEQGLAEEAQAIAEIVAEALQRPVANAHVIYEPPGFGRVAFGGSLVRKDGSTP